MYCVRGHIHSPELTGTHGHLSILTCGLVERMPKGGLEDRPQENLPIPRPQQNRDGPWRDGEPTSREAVIALAKHLAWVV